MSRQRPQQPRASQPSPRCRPYSSQANTPQQHRILVVGGGPAGSATAYFLAKAGFQVVVAERSTRDPYGQGIDITNEAVDVVKRMGLWEKIKANTTGETGFALLDDDAREIARVGVNAVEPGAAAANSAPSPTNEIEIMRGTLTKLVADAAKEQGVEYRYGCTVSNITQTDDYATATLTDSDEPMHFTAIIGADGLASQVRKLTFPKDVHGNCYRQTDTYAAYYSMPVIDDADRVTYSRFQHANKGRGIWLRPISNDGSLTSCYFLVTSPRSAELQKIWSDKTTTQEQQKATFEKLFADVSGLRAQAIRGMYDSDDFYFTRIVQIKLDTWHQNRCALVGDAAYCPSPLSGNGTTLALVGAYCLAGELAASPHNPAAAFARYKDNFKELINAEGSIPLGGYAPKLVEPQSQLGVWAVRQLFWLFTRQPTQKFFGLFGGFGGDLKKKARLPTYEL